LRSSSKFISVAGTPYLSPIYFFSDTVRQNNNQLLRNIKRVYSTGLGYQASEKINMGWERSSARPWRACAHRAEEHEVKLIRVEVFSPSVWRASSTPRAFVQSA
jgi:hypothetical protein